MKQRTKKRCFMIIALSLAALFLINNVTLVYAYEGVNVIPEFQAVATISDDQGNSYDLDVVVNHSTAKETNRFLSLSGDVITIGEVEATVVIPAAILSRDGGGEMYEEDEWDGSVTARVTLVYVTRNFPSNITGVLLTYVRNNCTVLESNVTLDKVVTYYYCNGTEADLSGLMNTQRGTKVGWTTSHSLSTDFSTYIAKDVDLENIGAISDFYLKMGNTRSWVTTVQVIF